MKVPKSINILGVIYQVKFVDDVKKEVNKPLEEKDKETEELVGYCSSNRNVIYISNKTEKQNYFSTFIHEVLEAIDSQLSLNIEHDTIDRLEAALYQIVVTNKKLLK